jgi:cyclin-dependent kinase 10
VLFDHLLLPWTCCDGRVHTIVHQVADFGMARTVGTQVDGRSAREGNLSPRVVTMWYRAPEVLFGDPGYGVAVDLWAVGCVLGELLLHEPMLPGKTEQQQVELLVRLFGVPHDGIWPEFSSLPLATTFRLPDQPHVELPSCFHTEG